MFLKGRSLGRTPLKDVSVPSGCAAFRFTYESGGRIQSRRIELKVELKGSQTFDLKLQSRRSGQPALKETWSSQRSRRNSPMGCVADPSMEGFVTIATQPVSRVFWQGRELGKTPLYKLRVPSGCVRFKFVYEVDGVEKTKMVPLKVKANAMNKFPLKLN